MTNWKRVTKSNLESVYEVYSKKNGAKRRYKKVDKGVRRMPRLSEATKDVVSCEKLRGAANKR